MRKPYPEQKICYVCETVFNRKYGVGLKAWERIRCCSLKCSKTTRKEVSLETREKMRIAKLGKEASSETKLKMSKAQKGRKHPWAKPFFTGCHHSEKTKAKIKKIKLDVGLRGEEHYRYIKDRTKLVKNEKKHLCSQYMGWAKAVKDRDNWKCKMSNCDCSGRLEAHHILRWSKFPELRYEVNNGITLCAFHHPRKINDEERLVPTFRELILTTN